MTIRKRMLTGCAVALLALLTSVWTVADRAGPVSAQVDLADVHQQVVDAVNAGDVDAALALFTEDAVLQGTFGCQTPCVGTEAIQAEFEALVADNAQITAIDPEVSGNTLTVREEITSDSIRAGGAERLVFSETVEFTDDKISSVVLELDLTDQQTADFAAALEADAEAALPSTGTGGLLTQDGTGTPIWWYALAAGGALLIVAGFGVQWRARGRR